MSSTHRERVGIDPSEKKRLLYLDRLKATPLFYDKQTLPRQSMGIVTASLSWERTVQQRKFLLLSAPKKCLNPTNIELGKKCIKHIKAYLVFQKKIVHKKPSN